MELIEAGSGVVEVRFFTTDLLALSLACRAVSFDQLGATWEERHRRQALLAAYGSVFALAAYASAVQDLPAGRRERFTLQELLARYDGQDWRVQEEIGPEETPTAGPQEGA